MKLKIVFITVIISMQFSSMFSQNQLGETFWGIEDLELLGFSSAFNEAGTRLAISSISDDSIELDSGKVAVFDWINNSWQQVGNTLYGDGVNENGDPEQDKEYFGTSVKLSASGDIMAVAAYRGDRNNFINTGYVKVFQLISNTWVQLGNDIVNGSQTGEWFGFGLDINEDGTKIVVSSPEYDGAEYNIGEAIVYEFTAGNWQQVGQSLHGDYGSRFGYNVSMNATGNQIVVSAISIDTTDQDVGAIYVFELINGSWTQIGNTLYGEAEYDTFGLALDMNAEGNRIVAGSYYNSTVNVNGGYAKIFEFSNNIWQQVGNTIYGQNDGDTIGYDVDITAIGDKVLLGSISSSTVLGNGGSGLSRLYGFINGDWSQIGEDLIGDTNLDYSGRWNSMNADASVLGISAYVGINGDGIRPGYFKAYYFPPTVICQNITISLDANGQATITSQDIDNGSYDIDEPINLSIDITTFDCNDIGLPVEVTISAIDAHGNSDSCTATVTVIDDLAPVLTCTTTTLNLDENGEAFLDVNEVIDSLTDNCEVAAFTVDISYFTCDDIGQPIQITVFASDVNGNSSFCTTTVTVLDELAPNIICPENQIVTVNQGETYTLQDYFEIGEASVSDNCTSPITDITQDPVVGTPLQAGIHTITLSATDAYGNSSQCSFELMVDEILGITSNIINSNIVLYPNPIVDAFTIKAENQIIEEVSIYNINGKLLYQFTPNKLDEAYINISNLYQGVYFVAIKTQRNLVTKRIIKK